MFMATDTAKAIHNLSKQQSPLIIAEASAIPIYSMNCGTPLENTIIAILIPMPKMPHTTARESTPNPFLLYTPALMRSPSISPKVASTPNFKASVHDGRKFSSGPARRLGFSFGRPCRAASGRPCRDRIRRSHTL